ncbi:hypothetical protein [Novosphingobium sp. BL-52-GroH]|uniref:hypothetical protein n=1 Tax=Novosphingobium sp. BL-52-GroH TaxID=3349877 RepID=UPI00384D746E
MFGLFSARRSPAHARGFRRIDAKVDFVAFGSLGMGGQHLGDKFGGAFQRGRRREGGRWRCPALQRRFEHRDGACIGHEQGKAGDDADPAVDFLVHLHKTGPQFHGCGAPASRTIAQTTRFVAASQSQTCAIDRNRKQKLSVDAQTGDISGRTAQGNVEVFNEPAHAESSAPTPGSLQL